METSAYLVREGYRSHKLKPYRKAAQAEQKLDPRLSTLSNPCSRERELPYCGSLSESGKSIGSPRHFIIIIIIFFFFFFFRAD